MLLFSHSRISVLGAITLEKGMLQKNLIRIHVLAAALAWVIGCDGGDGPAGPRPGPTECNVPVMFETTCAASSCHSGTNPEGGLDLGSPGVEERIVLVDGNDCFGFFADPSDPAGSILYRKVASVPDCGSRMPLGGPYLSDFEIACMNNWISGLQPPPRDGGTDDGSIIVDSGTDEGSVACPGCACQPGIEEPCYEALAETQGVAMCAPGMRTCQSTGLWGTCTGQVLPSVENCSSPADENCDGLTAACMPAWSIGFGLLRNQTVEGLDVDAAGNVYVVGNFEGTVDFGMGPLTSPGVGMGNENNVYVAKYSPLGEPVWARHFGDSSNQLSARLVADAAGNTVIIIRTRGTMNFGGTDLTTAGDSDIIVAKLDPDGNHVWSRILGGRYLERGERLAIDSNGDVVFVGKFTTQVTVTGFGTLNSEGVTDGLLVKLDGATGAVDFVVRLGGTGDEDYPFGVDTDRARNIYVTGRFGGTLQLGSDRLTAASGDLDGFVTKLGPSGDFLWSLSFPSAGADRPYDLAIDRTVVVGDGDVVLAGTFTGDINFDRAASPANTLTSAGGEDLFVVRLDGDGNYIFSRGYGDAADQLGADTEYSGTKWLSLAVGGSGHIYLGGPLWGSADFDPASPGGRGLLTSAGGADAFFVELDAAGAFVRGRIYGLSGSELGQDIAVGPSGEVLLGGRYYGSRIDFGTSGLLRGQVSDAEGFVVRIP